MASLYQSPQAPGQAQASSLPNLLASQKGSTPPAQVDQLAQLPVAQLQQIFHQTMQQPNSMVPPLSVLAAIQKSSEDARLAASMAGQAAQQQAAQQPGTIRDEVLAQSYAHGGIVALNSGGSVKSFADGGPTLEEVLRKAPAARTPEDNAVLRAAGYTLTGMESAPDGGVARFNRMLESPFIREAFTAGAHTLSPEELATRTDAGANWEKLSRLFGAEQAQPPATPAAPTPGMSPEAQALVDRQGQAPRGRTEAVAAPAATPTQRPDRGPRPDGAPARGPSAAPGGLGALIAKLTGQATGGTDPRLEALGKTMEANASERAALLKGMQGLSPEEAAARERYYTTLRGVYEPQRKAMEEARGATRQGLLSNPEALARMAAAVSGKKRFGEALGAAAGSAGEFMGERRKRAEQLEANYQTLKSQLALTMAQAQRADAEGDEKRKRELLLQAQGIKDSLTQAQMDLIKTGAEMQGRNVQGLASLYGAQAQQTQAQAAVARAAQDGTQQRQVQRYAQLQQAINTSPKLRAIAEKMKLMPSPALSAEYEAEERRLVRQWAPELLNNASPSAASTTLKYNPATGKIE